jgi:hypothetical protein
MRRVLQPALLVCCTVVSLSAQSSQFGVRGLGHPGRGLSVGAIGTEGSAALFDGRSSRNPAALGLLTGTSFVFTSTQAWRNSESPFSSGSTREQRFPHLQVGGPVPGSALALGLSYSTFAVRDYTLVSEGTDSPRGIPVAVSDTLGSTGGINDLRAAVSWTIAPELILGAGVHLLTGSNRVFSVRAWADSAYVPLRQSAELSYTGVGVSAGVVFNPTSRLHIGGTIRQDGSLEVRRDSTEIGDVDLPWTLSAGLRYRLTDRIAVSGLLLTQNWSVANDGVVGLGGLAARNTVEVAGGLEMIRSVRRPEHLPIRLGVRHTQLPFLLVEGSQPRELAVAVGTGLRFARDLGGVDLALERVQRSQGSDYSEGAWQLSVGVSLRGLVSGR